MKRTLLWLLDFVWLLICALPMLVAIGVDMAWEWVKRRVRGRRPGER